MPCQVTLAQLVQILKARPLNLPDSTLGSLAQAVTTDSRILLAGDVFLALRGESFDGHDFVASAIAHGAVAAIVDAKFPISQGESVLEGAKLVRSSVSSVEPMKADDGEKNHNLKLPLLQVQNTLSAYQDVAHWWRKQFSIPVIAVTGSVGKTTTKELIAAVLSTLADSQSFENLTEVAHKPSIPAFQVLKSQANYNNEIGVPKTLLDLSPTHQYAIVEMGMRGPGEISLLSKMACPDIAVITNVGTAHIGRLGSEVAIAQAKCELLAEMPADSIAILNHENPLLLDTAQTVWQGEVVTFGLEGGDLQGQLIDPETLLVDGFQLPLPLPGRHNALNYLAALAVAKVLGLDLTPLTQGLTVELPDGRAKRYDLDQDVVLLDETYNAGLESMLASLQLLVQIPGQRHIAVLGTMKELGSRSQEFHQQVGLSAQALKLDQLVILADEPEASAMATGAGDLPTERFTSHAEVVTRLKQLVQPGDRLLFKASRAVGLDRVVAQFCSEYSHRAE
jgi:UDP-N-acetylmuramoyl-tripeptide--D-alanyl-D-alanine ligase